MPTGKLTTFTHINFFLNNSFAYNKLATSSELLGTNARFGVMCRSRGVDS